MSYYKTVSAIVNKIGIKLVENLAKTHPVSTKENFRQLSIPLEMECELIIKTELLNAFPNYYVLGEESHATLTSNEVYIWLIDPLDGTINYTHKIKSIAISVALLQNYEPIFGLIFLPFTHETYWAQKGKGAFKDQNKIQVAKRKNISEAIISLGHGYYRNHYSSELHAMIKNCLRIRTNDSSAIEMCMVADGSIDAYMNSNQRLYDFCAGAFIISEAGGIFMDEKSILPKRIDRFSTSTIIATTPSFLDTLSQMLPSEEKNEL